MRKFGSKIIAVLCCLAIVISGSVTSEAATKTEFNDIARNLLSEYYNPEDCLDTCVYNIENCYTQQAYSDKDQLDAIYAKAEEITASANNDEEKVKQVHDWMCTNIDYASDLSGYNGYPYSELANPFTVFKNKQAVCYGFSNLTQMMLQHLGIPCVIVRGNSSSHVWNAVYLNDKWVFTDNTWDENLSSDSKISYRYYLMDNETYDNTYRTEYIENWAGDACYFPVYVTTSYQYHSIVLNSKGGKCRAKIPFSENMDKFVIPVPEREGRTFQKWNNDHDISGYYYAGFGGWYLSGGVKGTTEDIIFTAQYAKVNPEYEVPEGLIGYEGDTLADVMLPEGFAWVDGTQQLTETGTFKFKANYTPEDTDDYNIVKNIEIEVTVQDLSAEILSDAKKTNEHAAEELDIAEQFHSDVSVILGSLESEYTSETDTVDASLTALNAKLEAYRDLLTRTNESVNKAEKAYNDFKANKGVTEAQAKALLATANKNIAELEKQTPVIKKEIESARTKLGLFTPSDNLWSENELTEEISTLQQLLLDVDSALSGTEKIAEGYDAVPDDIASLITSLTENKEALSTELQEFTANKAAAEKLVSDIEAKRSELETAVGVAEAEVNAVNTSAMKARLTKASTITKKKIAASTVTISLTRCTYLGKAYKPVVTVKGLVRNRDYTVSYANNIKVGTGKVIVKGIGNYTGTVTKTFTIITPKPVINGLSLYNKNTCKIKVKALSGVTRYQVGYKLSTSKKWSYRTLSAQSNVITMKSLAHKKKYQFKVRAICPKTTGGNTYSSWSAVKAITTK